MSGLIKKNEKIANKDTNLIKPSGISILQKLKGQKRAFLVDVSGSMENKAADGSRISIVNGLIESLQEELQTARLFKFSDYCVEVRPIFGGKIPALAIEGGTGMHKAFEKMHEENIKEIVLLTDGQPDIPELALRAARGLKIDIVYIGPQPAPQFLKDLAATVDGKFMDQNMLKEGSSLLLKEKIQKLLSAGSK